MGQEEIASSGTSYLNRYSSISQAVIPFPRVERPIFTSVFIELLLPCFSLSNSLQALQRNWQLFETVAFWIGRRKERGRKLSCIQNAPSGVYFSFKVFRRFVTKSWYPRWNNFFFAATHFWWLYDCGCSFHFPKFFFFVSFFFFCRKDLHFFICDEILTSYSVSFSRGQFNNIFTSLAIVFKPWNNGYVCKLHV